MELSRTRAAIQHAMTSLVMEDSTPVDDDDPDRPARRLDLRPLNSPGAQRLFGLARLTGNDLGAPQTFEVVAGRVPTPMGSLVTRPPGPGSAGEDDEREGDDASLDATDRPTHRGVFELWPDDAPPRSAPAERAWPNAEGMTLWWIPLEEPESGSGSSMGGAVPLASGLIACQWRVLHERERKTVYDATWVVDLPGYVEFEATTNTGIHVNWMFEIMWTEGPEEEPGAPGDDDEEVRGAGGPAGGSASDGEAGVEGRPPTGPVRRGGGDSRSSGGRR
jgi:hypothetical protein